MRYIAHDARVNSRMLGSEAVHEGGVAQQIDQSRNSLAMLIHGVTLRFIDDQNGASVSAVLSQQKIEEVLEHLDLLLAAMFQIEGEQDPLQQLSKRTVGVRDKSHGHVSVHLTEYVADQRSLAGADFPGDYIEPSLIHKAIFQQGQRHAVFGT